MAAQRLQRHDASQPSGHALSLRVGGRLNSVNLADAAYPPPPSPGYVPDSSYPDTFFQELSPAWLELRRAR